MTQLPLCFHLALAQLNFKIGELAGNFVKINEVIDRARAEKVELLVFSELALTGFPPLDLVYRRPMIALQNDYLEQIAGRTDEGFGIVVGFVDVVEQNGGVQLFDAAALCFEGKVVARIHKKRLVDQDVASDSRYFSAGNSAHVHEFKGVKLGVFVGEDIGFLDESAGKNTDLLINLAAVPFALDKVASRRECLAKIAIEHEQPLVFVNQVGGNGELIFDGNSAVFGREGQELVGLKAFEEDYRSLDVFAGVKTSDRAGDAEFDDVQASLAHSALVLGVRDYVRKSGFKSVVLGLSGGIDSALVAALATEALGPENVVTVGMPSRYSSAHSVTDARELAENLGVRFDLHSIEPELEAFLSGLAPFFEGRAADVTEENLQARIRGMILMALSNKFGHLVLAPGNKSEVATGYTTLYGDMNGAVMVLGDVPKTLAYRIARHINEKAGREIVPEHILTKAPSAELSPDQVDQDSLPAYEILDAIIKGYVEDTLSAEEIVAQGFDAAVVSRVISMIHRAEYKRAQAPPVLRVSSKSFGSGWRYPLVANYFWRR